MFSTCFGRGIFCLLVLSLVVAGCGTATPEADSQTSPLAHFSPLPTATPLLTPTPAPTSTPMQKPIRLVVLHTNDNWGETEPCG